MPYLTHGTSHEPHELIPHRKADMWFLTGTFRPHGGFSTNFIRTLYNTRYYTVVLVPFIFETPHCTPKFLLAPHYSVTHTGGSWFQHDFTRLFAFRVAVRGVILTLDRLLTLTDLRLVAPAVGYSGCPALLLRLRNMALRAALAYYALGYTSAGYSIPPYQHLHRRNLAVVGSVDVTGLTGLFYSCSTLGLPFTRAAAALTTLPFY